MYFCFWRNEKAFQNGLYPKPFGFTFSESILHTHILQESLSAMKIRIIIMSFPTLKMWGIWKHNTLLRRTQKNFNTFCNLFSKYVQRSLRNSRKSLNVWFVIVNGIQYLICRYYLIINPLFKVLFMNLLLTIINY